MGLNLIVNVNEKMKKKVHQMFASLLLKWLIQNECIKGKYDAWDDLIRSGFFRVAVVALT